MTLTADYLETLKADLDSIGFAFQAQDAQAPYNLDTLADRIQAVGAIIHEYPALQLRYTEITQQLDALRVPISSERSEEKENPDLIVADMNQYTGRRGMDASACTSCAAAFIRNVLRGNPLSIATIQSCIRQGQAAHDQASARVVRGANANLSAIDVLTHGDLNLRSAGRPISGRVKSTAPQEYRNIMRGLERGRAAILTKAPYSSAIIRRENDYVYFDSHGEPETGNRAFIRTFRSEEDLCGYLAHKYGYIDFDDVDFDIATGQDNPNMYELTFVEAAQIQQPRSCIRSVATRIFQIGRAIWNHPVAAAVTAAAIGASWIALT
ncbi:MAG: hypothetical protein K1X28_02300 [Parachlamydiales bacterium]|nr:hypothetical protein [Parachlamydiales bacterium]